MLLGRKSEKFTVSCAGRFMMSERVSELDVTPKSVLLPERLT